MPEADLFSVPGEIPIPLGVTEGVPVYLRLRNNTADTKTVQRGARGLLLGVDPHYPDRLVVWVPDDGGAGTAPKGLGGSPFSVPNHDLRLDLSDRPSYTAVLELVGDSVQLSSGTRCLRQISAEVMNLSRVCWELYVLSGEYDGNGLRTLFLEEENCPGISQIESHAHVLGRLARDTLPFYGVAPRYPERFRVLTDPWRRQ